MKAKELENIEKQTLMEEIFDQIDTYVMVLDNRNTVLIANKKVKEKYGNVIGKKCYEVHHKTPKAPDFCVMNCVKDGITGDTTFFDDAITKRWYDVSVSKILVGDKCFFVHLMTDVNEKHFQEEKIIELNQALRVLNKILRHDILNNITVIMLSLEMMKTEDISLKNRALSAIQKSVELVNKMRDLETAISSGGELKPYDAKTKLAEIIISFPEIKFKIEGNCKILADEAIISVFNNLLRNAVIHGKADKVDIFMEKKSGFCTIKISDNGVGIPDVIKDKLFDEGVSYDENKGMGLGLYIVKKTIERYGGDVSFENNVPKGTTFILKLKKSL